MAFANLHNVRSRFSVEDVVLEREGQRTVDQFLRSLTRAEKALVQKAMSGKSSLTKNEKILMDNIRKKWFKTMNN